MVGDLVALPDFQSFLHFVSVGDLVEDDDCTPVVEDQAAFQPLYFLVEGHVLHSKDLQFYLSPFSALSNIVLSKLDLKVKIQ